MGTLLLLLALIFEIAFAIYCMVTKQNHKKIKNWIRIAIFIAFVILTLSSVIVWSLRWVLFALLLFILAVKAAISLIRNKTNTQKYKTSKIVWKSIIMLLALVFALAPAVVFPQHKSPKVTGTYEVATATYTYVDKNRIEEFTDKGDNRFVNVEFWYPKKADGKYPLLVFSHGAYGIKSSNTSTYTELASHGYVVVSIDHPYHSFYTRSEDGTVAMINTEYNREVNDMNKDGIYTKEELYGAIQKWMKLRTDDMNFVIDTILEKAKSDNNPIYQQINTEKIGVFGHSMGGAASVWLGRERKDIAAVVNIDAPFFSDLVYKKEIDDFVARDEDFKTPLLNIYSDDVWEQLDSNSTYAANKLNNEHFKDANTVHFKGAKHLSLTDFPLFSPILANYIQGGKADIDQNYCIETENKLILNFFDDKLKGIGHFTSKETY
ncbi:platelet-activating factor acetylhydrolase, plasma/intracellular isoform II [Neobacillus bataviensis LMG 21833]|uniref:Platelet-activating factor acetylhydrolase, plasma/intracellular isoform II n=1 Tax=Neobacillus bataviensis LMG 21833 TaxID=1117379 RepID=K6D2C2_9BACI|nr:dienelactone hydrolase family protein [Neobacillus bataviensis]EKN62394.1 platelet-activating factor acetylhydrolase, plasma/intracellular isoform II [Neobacillus bataviensis LMG 21833]